MPPRTQNEEASPANGVDRIGALPDEILNHILSLLPAQEAVRTCKLARRWRHLWKYTTGLRIVGIDHAGSVKELRKFMHHLLIFRERTDLETCEIKFRDYWEEDDCTYMELWIRFAIMCRVRTLILHLDGTPVEGNYCDLDLKLLVFRHLKKLDLYGVGLYTDLDYSSCPTLEDLKMKCCDISADKISSQFLMHLSITDCHVFMDCWACVSAPCLISLELDRITDNTILFESMPLLETAFVNDPGKFCGANGRSCRECDADDGASRDCVLLGAISNAKHLELKSSSQMFIVDRDMRLCPTFGKLKTLILNDNWCVAPHFNALTYILKRSPVLEKLTLLLFTEGQKHKVEMNGYCCSMEASSAFSKHLQIVAVKCTKVDGRVLEVLKFLCAFNIRFSFQ